ncbi:MAG TPA: glycosyltransferase family 39 protein [Candidatus Dormibacteraeota bacterium]
MSWGWIAAAGGLITLAHAPSFFHRLDDSDEAIYSSIAALMNAGGALYSDGGVDNKPPGIFWVYAATFRIFGVYQMTAVHVVALLFIGATCWLLFLIGRRLSSSRAGLLAAVLYGVLTGQGNPGLQAANAEVLMMLPLAASVLVMLGRRWMWSGALLVAAIAFKQVAAANLLLVPAAIVLLEPERARLRAAVSFGAGLVAAMLVGAAILELTSSLTGFWHWSVASLYGFAAMNWKPDQLWFRVRDSLPYFVGGTAVIWVAAIAFASRWRGLRAAERVVVVWLAASAVGSVAGGHLFYHYFVQVMGPLALVGGIAIDRALDSPEREHGKHLLDRRWIAAAIVVGVAVPTAAWGVYDLSADPLTYNVAAPVPQHAQVAAYIKANSRPADRIFVWGDSPNLYVESDRLMASRFPGFLRGFARGSALPPNNWDTAPEVWPELQADLERNPPALIVDTAAAGWSDFAMYPMSNYPVLQDLVTTNYHLAAVVDGVAIYTRSS